MRHLRFTSTTCAILVLACARLAAAQPAADRAAAAEALFDRGRGLMAEQRYAEACAKFAESERLDHGLGTLLNLADCYERNGQTASAWATFREVLAAAITERQPERESIAREREKALRSKLVKLKIVVPPDSAVQGLSIWRDGTFVKRPQWGVPLPVDPGVHIIDVRAPGKQASVQTVEVPARAGAEIAVDIKPLAERTHDVSSADASRGRAQRAAGIAVGGVGVIGAVIGSAFGVRAIQKNGASADHCVGDRCDALGVALRSDAIYAGTASTIAFVAAGAMVAGGAVLYFAAPRGGKSTKAARVGLMGSGAGLSLEAAW